LKNKILIVGNALTNSQVLEVLEEKLEVVKIYSGDQLKAGSDLRDVLALWVHFDTFLDESFLAEISHIPYLISTTTGLTHISKEIQDHFGKNLISLRGRGKFLTRITSTAEHAWLLILLWNNNVFKSLESVRNGNWLRSYFFRENQLSGKTIGIIGFGRLGKMLANYALAFKMNVIIYEIEDEAINQAKSLNLKVVKSIEELFALCNIITINANYKVGNPPIITKETLRFINKPFLLVNTARAGLVDENSIIHEIKNRPYLYYYTDVLSCEENGTSVRDSDLWELSKLSDRIRITPHIGGANLEAAELCENELLADFLQRIKFVN
jgi:D-3-phosphoglycerate dehydrogenase